ncbi:hypothetical protein DRQ36_07910 [bacterium]|nr:MAG: hypothetical protein DRQ36_07910 [bacterium]
MRVRHIIAAVFLFAGLISAQQISLTTNNCDSLQFLPITPEQRDAICERIRFGGGFESVYELLELGVFTPKEFEALKPLVKIGKPFAVQSSLERIDSLYFRIGEWLTGESISDELIDEWLNAIRERPVLSELDYRDLVSLQNLDPPDAVALLRHRYNIGNVKDRRQLRSVKGLSARGYVSVRSYIGYGDPKPISWFTGGYVQARFGGDAGESKPYSSLKISIDNGPISEGIRFGRNEGEQIENGEWANPLSYPDAKFYVGLTRYNFGPVRIRHFVIGDYSAAFGEGITFNSGDYYSPRRTGTGFDVRKLGIYPDLSASQTYALRGAALELKCSVFEPTIFFSSRSKEAILQVDTTDFSVDTTIVQDTIFTVDTVFYADTSSFAELITGLSDWDSKVEETIWGGDITASPFLNLRLGITGYMAKYNLPWNPYPGAIIAPKHLPGGDNPKVTDLDAELLYATYRQDFRSAIGVHGLWTIGNLALSGEYSEIVRDSNITLDWHNDGSIDTLRGDKTSPLPFGDDPFGFVAKAQLITNRLSALALYRHYDLGFDNPYNRGFSEYARYKGSLIEDDYRLTNPDFVALAEENPRPMAEDGLYLELYGRPFRQLATTLQFDAFKRLSDMADYRRIVLKANWYLNNNLTFRLWRKWQGRSAQNALTPTSFTVDEIRLTAETRLSGYSRLGFTVIHSYLGNPPRPQYSGPADPFGESPYVGSVIDPSDGVMLSADINATEHLNISGQAIVYRGWLWNFEDNEFAELESATDAFRWWIAVSDRMVQNLSATVKLTVDTPSTASNIDIRDTYGDPENEIEGSRVFETKASWRIQLDYFF